MAPHTGGEIISHQDDGERSRVQVIDKAIELLDALSKAPNGLHVAEMARRVGNNRSTAYRILGTLIAHRLVMRNNDLTYRLGFRLFELGSSVKEHHLAFHGAAIAHLRAGAESLGMTAFLCIRDRDRALFVEQAVYGDIQYVAYPAGTSLPLNTGAASRVLLAYASEEDLDRLLAGSLERLTAMSITDPEELRRELRDIRSTGIAVSDGDVTLGLGAIGAPLVNARGQVIAAVSLAGVSQRLFGPERPAITDTVRQMATAISRELGWSGQRPQRATPPATTT
jgi:DNA-binding IclR family transcriptional regulator